MKQENLVIKSSQPNRKKSSDISWKLKVLIIWGKFA